MINIPPIKPNPSLKISILPEITKTWKINEVINATIERGGEALSKILLRIGQNLLETQSPIPLKTGDSVKLLVKSLGDIPLLSIQTSATRAELATDKLRLFIVQQQNLSSFIDMAQKMLVESKIPAEIKILLNQLISHIPTKEQLLKPTKLKQAIQSSGVFLEPKLATQKTVNINADIKAQLIKINQVIQNYQPTSNTSTTKKNLEITVTQFIKGESSIKQLGQQLPLLLDKTQLFSLEKTLTTFNPQTPRLSKTDNIYNLNQLITYLKKSSQSRQLVESLLNSIKSYIALKELKLSTENTLSSITSQQLIPLTKEADNFLLLLFGILIKDKNHIDLINFKVEQDANNHKDKETGWTVTLNFQFKILGELQARVHLLNTQISTVFTAESTHTIQLIKNNFQLLNNAFLRLGFNKITLDVSKNKINTLLDKPDNIQILDERA